MAVSINWGGPFVGVLRKPALLFGSILCPLTPNLEVRAGPDLRQCSRLMMRNSI